MAERMPGDPDAGGRFVRLDDGDMHVVEDGRPGGPAVLLIHGTAASAAWWDPVIPQLAGAYRVIRVDLAGHGRSATPAGEYDIPAPAPPAGALLDRRGAGQAAATRPRPRGDLSPAPRAPPAPPRAAPGARVELLPGVGHPPHQEAPDTPTPLLLAFAARAGRRAGPRPRSRRPAAGRGRGGPLGYRGDPPRGHHAADDQQSHQ